MRTNNLMQFRLIWASIATLIILWGIGFSERNELEARIEILEERH